jgi:hypothetical protein
MKKCELCGQDIPIKEQIKEILTDGEYPPYKSVIVNESKYLRDYDIWLGKRTEYSDNDNITSNETRKLFDLGLRINTISDGYMWLSKI